MITNEKSYAITDENNEISEEDDTYRQDVIFTKNTIRIFEIWDKMNNKVCHGLRECYEDDLYMSEDDFEEIIWDDVFEIRYIYSGEVIETFERLRELADAENYS